MNYQEEIIPRTKNPFGALFLFPMVFVLLAVLFLPLAMMFYRALTDFNALEVPKFIGFANYVKLFSEDEIFQIALKNNFTNALLVTLIVGLPAFVASRLVRAVHKAVRYIVVLLFDLVSLFVLSGGINFLFSGDVYGMINGWLIKSECIKEPILFFNMYAPQMQQLIICLILFGPVLTVLSLIKTREVSVKKIKRLLFPLKCSIPVYIAGGLPVLLTPVCWNTVMSAVGFPSTNYAAHTIIDHYVDYESIRFQLGYASAINVVFLVWMLVFLFAFFVLSCGVMNLVALIKNSVSFSKPLCDLNNQNTKIIVYALNGVLIVSALILLFPLFIMFLNSIKDISEIFMFPPKIFPQKVSLQSYIDLFALDLGNYHFSGWLFNMAVAPFLPALFVTAVSGASAFGVAYFDYKARRILYSLILLSFVLLPATFLPDYLNRLLVNNIVLLAAYAAFLSAAPLIGFVYFKSVIERARQYGHSLFVAIPLNCIPVFFITYVMCFVNPFVNLFLYNNPGFTTYFFWFQSGGIARMNIDSAAKLILTGITFGFILVAAVTAMVFFPRERKDHP